MFGAPKWLEENMDLTKAQAKQVFMAWTETFNATS